MSARMRPAGGTVRIIKGLIFYMVFCSLCAGAVLGTMRLMAVRSGRSNLYADWLGEIKDAFREAGEFISESYEKLESLKGG